MTSDRDIYDYVHDDGGEFTPIWSNPDVPSVHDVLASDIEMEFMCPGEDCENDLTITMDEESDVEDMIDDIDSADGTMRCGKCDEPLFGFFNDGDHDYDDDDRTGFLSPSKPPASVKP